MEILLLVILVVLVWVGIGYLSNEINVLIGEIRKIKNRDDDDMK